MIPKFCNYFERELWIAFSRLRVPYSIDLGLSIGHLFQRDHKCESASNINLGREAYIPSKLFDNHL